VRRTFFHRRGADVQIVESFDRLVEGGHGVMVAVGGLRAKGEDREAPEGGLTIVDCGFLISDLRRAWESLAPGKRVSQGRTATQGVALG
jgi:hypothetical protein